MTSAELRARLNAHLIIFDGGIGTEIYRRNYFINTSFEQLSLTAPEVISEIHRQYAEAGAQVLTANTFNGSRSKLTRYGLGDQAAAINAAAIRLARGAVREDGLVAGAIGPADDPDAEAAAAALAEQAGWLLDAGADFLIFESLSTRAELGHAIAAAGRLERTHAGSAFFYSFALDDEARAIGDGAPFAELLAAVKASGVEPAAVGLNCGRGPESTLAALERVAPQAELPLVVQPNSGVPRQVDNRTIYLTSPEYFSTYALRYLNLGARGLGGCCGITPTHIRDMARSVRPVDRAADSGRMIVELKPETRLLPEVPLAERSKLGARLASGGWIREVELTPPRGFDLAATVAKAIRCREAGIDAVNLPDGPRASARISSLAAALEIQRQAGIETVLHVCGRDRNLIALQAELLGCAALGIHNLLFVTGDPPKLGEYPFSSGVFDLDSIGMARMAQRMNRGVDVGGKELDQATATVIAVGADPNAIDPEREYRRLCEKAEAGAELIITQPVFDVKPLFRFLDRIAHLKLPLVAGVWPLASYRNAEFMRNEVPGVVVPDEIMLRMAAATGREEQRATGIGIARELVLALRGRVNGIQVSAPFGNVETALAVHAAVD